MSHETGRDVSLSPMGRGTGVREFKPIESHEPLTLALSLWEREHVAANGTSVHRL
jgi:hypothetical protein